MIFTIQTSFLMLNQQHQSIDGNTGYIIPATSESQFFLTVFLTIRMTGLF